MSRSSMEQVRSSISRSCISLMTGIMNTRKMPIIPGYVRTRMLYKHCCGCRRGKENRAIISFEANLTNNNGCAFASGAPSQLLLQKVMIRMEGASVCVLNNELRSRHYHHHHQTNSTTHQCRRLDLRTFVLSLFFSSTCCDEECFSCLSLYIIFRFDFLSTANCHGRLRMRGRSHSHRSALCVYHCIGQGGFTRS